MVHKEMLFQRTEKSLASIRFQLSQTNNSGENIENIKNLTKDGIKTTDDR